MLLFGWTTEQIAYAKQRHDRHVGAHLEANAASVLALQKWWALHDWPAPLSVLFYGVNLQKGCTDWAAEAVCATSKTVPYIGA